jgi:hypothetical protein
MSDAADLVAIDEEIRRLHTQISERHPDDELAVILDWQQIDELLEHRFALASGDDAETTVL